MTIIKPKNDNRDYEYYVLSNGLRVFIIQDSSKICGASLSVRIGSIDDTDEGIAHFLEHMLFMGSEKYPDEEEFMKFITINNGSTNAYTDKYYTNYYFTIGTTSFLKALDIFSNFFISPLLKEDCIKREVIAVDSEHQKNINNDFWRTIEITKQLLNPSNPISRFHTGNKKTLTGDNLHHKVKDFYETYYSSHLMTLTIYISSEININELKEKINNTFLKIKRKNIEPRRTFGNIILQSRTLRFEPLMDIRQLVLLFESGNYYDKPKENPYPLISHILGSESNNSITKYLIDKGWLISLNSHSVYLALDRSLYQIAMVLSESGMKHKNEIIDFVFNYIQKFRDSLDNKDIEEIHNQIIKKEKIDFDNWTKTDPIDTIMTISEYLANPNLDPNEIFCLGTLSKPYIDIKNNIMNVLNDFLHEKYCIIISHKNCLDNHVLLEKHYGIKYNIYDAVIDKSNVISWISLPKPNKYLPDKITLINEPSMKEPIIINETPYSKSFYNFDSSFRDPSTLILIKIKIPKVYKNATNFMGFVLMSNAIYSDNNSIFYDMEEAGYNISITYHGGSLIISANGYTEKIDVVLDKILRIIMDSTIKDISFFATKENMRNNLENEIYDAPSEKIMTFIKETFLKNIYTAKDCLSVIDSLTLADCRTIFLDVLSESYITTFISGNINRDKTINIVDNINHYFVSIIKTPYLELIEDKNDVEMLREKFVKIKKNENIDDKNSASAYLIQLHKFHVKNEPNWKKHIVFNGLLRSILANDYYDQLRTKEQLGYIVDTSVIHLGSPYYINNYLVFIVQSPNKDSEFLLQRTEKFINDTISIIKNIKPDSFEKLKHTMIEAIDEPYVNIGEYTSYLYSFINDETYMFNRKILVRQAIDDYTLEEFKNMYNTYVINNNKRGLFGITRHL